MDYLQAIDFFERPEFGDFYDELPLWSAPFGLLILDRVPLHRGMTILDIGAGTGFLTLELAQRCGLESTVIAVDPWSSAVARLHRKVAYLQLSNVVVREQDAAQLDLPDESIDLFVSNLGVNNFANAEEVVRNCFRMAKPNARIVLSSNLVGHMAEFYQVFERILIEMGQQNRIEALHAHIDKRATVQSMRRLLEQSGFEFLEAITASFRLRFTDGSALLRHHFIRLGFVQAWQALSEPSQQREFFARLEERLNAVAAMRGELTLTIPMACVEGRRAAGGEALA